MYLKTTGNVILVLDVQSLCLSVVDLVDEMEVPNCDDFDISEAESQQEFYLLCLHQTVLRIWVHHVQSSVWHLTESIDLHDIFQRSGILGSDVADGSTDCDFGLYGALDSKLIFVGANDYICLFNIKDKIAIKVYQISAQDGDPIRICPCMTIWPPTFSSELIRHVEQERWLLLEELGTDGQSSRPEDLNRFLPLETFEGSEIPTKENVRGLVVAVGDLDSIISDQMFRLEELSDSIEKEIPIDVLIYQSRKQNFVNAARGKSVGEPECQSKVQFLLEHQEPEA